MSALDLFDNVEEPPICPEPSDHDLAVLLKAIFNYRDHQAAVYWDAKDGLFKGHLLHLVEKVKFETEDANDLVWVFERTVDIYLDGDKADQWEAVGDI
jgi:hypothetical protein